VNGIEYVRKDSIPKSTNLAKPKNKMPFVMIRAYGSGVHFGYLKSKKPVGDMYAVELVDSRRVYKWAGACSLSQLALEGTKDSGNCQIAVIIPEIEISGVIEIIPITTEAKENLEKIAVWKK
jgi:hypothetical protein